MQPRHLQHMHKCHRHQPGGDDHGWLPKCKWLSRLPALQLRQLHHVRSPGLHIDESQRHPEGAITGQYFVFLAPIQYQGFLRSRDGSIITFNPPNSTYTNPVGINPEGAITGWSMDASRVTHGFLRTRDGTLITIDAPGAGTGSFEGTVAVGIIRALPGAIRFNWIGSRAKARRAGPLFALGRSASRTIFAAANPPEIVYAPLIADLSGPSGAPRALYGTTGYGGG